MGGLCGQIYLASDCPKPNVSEVNIVYPVHEGSNAESNYLSHFSRCSCSLLQLARRPQFLVSIQKYPHFIRLFISTTYQTCLSYHLCYEGRWDALSAVVLLSSRNFWVSGQEDVDGKGTGT